MDDGRLTKTTMSTSCSGELKIRTIETIFWTKERGADIQILYRYFSIHKRFKSKINVCTCSNVLAFVSCEKDMSPYSKRFKEGVQWYAEIAFTSTILCAR